jgi:hypothetical protein
MPQITTFEFSTTLDKDFGCGYRRHIARNSSFTYKGKAVDIKQVGRELGVRYVLEGSVRKAGKGQTLKWTSRAQKSRHACRGH